MEASFPGQDHWLRDYCASGLYILTLLLEGFGFSEETWPGLEFRKQVTTSQGSSHQSQGKGGLGALGQLPVAVTCPCVCRLGAPTLAGR